MKNRIVITLKWLKNNSNEFHLIMWWFSFFNWKIVKQREFCLFIIVCGFYTEFAAVLLNISNGALVDCFHHFVRPTRYPILSPYCINLTGITQAHIDLHEPFLNIYNKFLNWLRKLQLEMGLRFTSNDEINASDGPNATFCSWSNWDLEFFFPIECARYHITCPIKLKAWIDVSVLFEVSFCIKISK